MRAHLLDAARVVITLHQTMKPLTLLLLLALPVMVQAQFTFTTNDGAISIAKYTGAGGAVTIPNMVKGLPVTAIGTNAFFGCISLSSITIPKSITSVGDNAFSYCLRLASVAFGKNITKIGSGAFFDCINLPDVTIPASVTSIGNNPFGSCSQLTAITVDELNSVYSSVDGVLFNKSQSKLIQYPGGKAGPYTIPQSVTTLDGCSFTACTGLTSVTIPKTVTDMGIGTFHFCSSLKNVYFKGNNPGLDWDLFSSDSKATINYLPGTTGWGATFGGRPTALWKP